MKFRFLLTLLLTAGICLSIQWTETNSSRADLSGQEIVKKKKKKKAKKPKKKKTGSKKEKKEDPKKIEKEKAKAKKKKEKRTAQQDKRAQKIHEDREKKKEKIAKEQEKKRGDYSKCDSSDVVRTSKDTLLLVKYMKVYKSLGGICYIIHLQEMGRLEKTSDGHYSVAMRSSKDPRAPADWQTYLFCPIGKPDGLIALTSPVGDTIQTCNYVGEKKEGMMTYYKNKKVFYVEKYTNDNKIAEAEVEYDGN